MQILETTSGDESITRRGCEILSADGIVVLRGAIGLPPLRSLQEKMLADLDQRSPDRSANRWNSLRPPPFEPWLFNEVVYNPLAMQICREFLGAAATLTTYGANTSWPGQAEPQTVHRDVPDGPVQAGSPGVVINIPLTEFTCANGATRIYPGSHLSAVAAAPAARQYSPAMLESQARRRAPEQTVGIRPGDLVIRDLRLWHGGMPNQSDERRIMLALVVIDADYRAADESGFKGFEAEIGSERFWSHPLVDTSVVFVPAGDRTYYLRSHHSTPATPLRVDWERRQAEARKSNQA